MTKAATQRPDPRVMQGVIPYLSYAGRAGEAMDFYARAFGATELGRMPEEGSPGRLMHGQVEINGGAFMVTDHAGPEGPPPTILPGGHLQLVVADARAWWDRAIAASCAQVMPLERQFWGDDWGIVVDPFGINWAILQPGPQT